MNPQNLIDTRFGASRDMLGYTPGATPSADTWLGTFTSDFVAHADATRGAHALMSGLRFYTPAFVAEIGALPPVESRLPPIRSRSAQAVYTAAGPIIRDVYERLIRQHAGRTEIQAAFAEATPGLLAQYHAAPATDNGMDY